MKLNEKQLAALRQIANGYAKLSSVIRVATIEDIRDLRRQELFDIDADYGWLIITAAGRAALEKSDE